jgi:hypothetical protein
MRQGIQGGDIQDPRQAGSRDLKKYFFIERGPPKTRLL